MRAIALTLLFALSITLAHAGDSAEQLAQQVRDAESAFAATMAQRDLNAFATYVAEDAVFFDGLDARRGRAAIVEGWKPLYQGEKAPFSWQSETVAVLADGTLAHSSGPVLDSQGRRVGTFNSVWRRGADGKWQVVFDKGCPVCNCQGKAD
ncbi:MAG TPA: nuclear transport factor 2 family protein [Povalibacter sp.]|nr:nuclear transport factor 2 family protein [Povalibacter sp.]